MRKLFLIFCGLVLASQITGAQTLSTIPTNGASIGVAASGSNFTPVAVGQFSSAGQPLEDILTVDFQGSFECLSNAGSGNINAPIVSPVTIAWPISAIQVLNFGTAQSPATDSILIVTSAGLATLYSTSGCHVTQAAQTALLGAGAASGLLDQNFFVACSGGLVIEDAALDSTACTPAPTGNVMVGDFGNGFNIAVFSPAVGQVPSTFTLGSYASGAFTWLLPATAEGANLLGVVFLNGGIVEIVSQGGISNGAQGNIFIQELLVSQESASLNTINIYSADAISMSYSNGVLAIAGGSGISLFNLNPDGSSWTQGQTLSATDDVFGFAAGVLVAQGETDYVLEVGETTTQSANIFASIPFVESGTVAPAFTSANTVTFTEMQPSTFTLTASGDPAPTFSVTGALPQGITFNGTELLGTPAQGTAGTAGATGIYALTFAATNGVSSPATQQFVLDIKSDAPPMFNINVTDLNPSEGVFSVSPPMESTAGWPTGTIVTLTGVPNPGFVFVTFAGYAGCGSTNPCEVTIGTANISMTGSFAPASNPAISVLPQNQSGTPGSSFTYQVTAANFSSNPTLSVTASIPAGRCTTSGMTVACSTTAPSASFVAPGGFFIRPTILIVLFSGILLSVGRRRRIVWALGAMVLCGSCGGGSTGQKVPTQNSGTVPGSYQIQIQATNGAKQAASVSASLTIN